MKTNYLQLPLLAANQAQKHVTHNEALVALDALVHLSVLDRDSGAPPASPAAGNRYCVAGGGSGLWSGKDGKIAVYDNDAWIFFTPQAGWLCWVEDENLSITYDGSDWVETGGVEGPSSMVGINATADTTNRLALASAASLFSHEGNSHRLKINKASASDTASLMFQNNFSGRAEMGLAGTDDFSFKVSADGTAWNTALSINRSTGAVNFPHTVFAGGRETLTANRTYYVRADGSNSNNGLTNTSSGAFLTLQKAYDLICSMLDLGGYTVTVQIADGTYTGGLLISQPWTGGGAVTFQGNVSTPANVLLNVTNTDAIKVTAPLPGILIIKGFKITTVTTGYGIYLKAPGSLQYGNINFGACATGHIIADGPGANLAAISNYTISGGASFHIITNGPARAQVNSLTLTIIGTPAFASAFVFATRLSIIEISGNTYSGSATGARYSVDTNSVIYSGATLPGSMAGSTTTGGQYV